jgi:transducin (beta)-like 1
VHVFAGHTDEINAICWSPDGSYLASCSDDTTAKVWVLDPNISHPGVDVEGKGSYMKYNLLGHAKEIYTTRWTPTGPGSNNPDKPLYLCTASFDGYVKVWNMVDGGLVYSLCSHTTLSHLGNNENAIQPVYSVSASPNGLYLAIGSQGGFVSVWDMQTGSMLVEEQGIGDTFDVSWSYDGELLSACFASGIVNSMNVKNLLQNDITMEPSEIHAIIKSEQTVSSPMIVTSPKGKEVETSSPVPSVNSNKEESDSAILPMKMEE